MTTNKTQDPRPTLLATEVEEGAVFLDPETGQVVYTVERVLYQDDVNGLQLLVRYASDRATGSRTFDITKRTPLVQPLNSDDPLALVDTAGVTYRKAQVARNAALAAEEQARKVENHVYAAGDVVGPETKRSAMRACRAAEHALLAANAERHDARQAYVIAILTACTNPVQAAGALAAAGLLK